MLKLALPLLSTMADLALSYRRQVSEETGVPEQTVEKVTGALSTYLQTDDRARALAADHLERARAYHAATQVQHNQVVDLARGLVRPVITFSAFFFYLFARFHDIPLTDTDYAMIGGILAFWFGFRPFEKNVKVR